MSTTHEPPLHAHRLHFDPWHVAVVVLVATLVALAAWTVIDNYTGGTSTTKDEQLVENVLAAWNARDGDAIGRLYTEDAVLSFGLDDPNAIIGRSAIQQVASDWGNTVTQVGESITLADPPGGFTRPIEGVDHHYVVAPVLIHDDPFVTVLDVRNGKVSTHMVFEPYEPFRD
jgi:hypothetical protein